MIAQPEEQWTPLGRCVWCNAMMYVKDGRVIVPNKAPGCECEFRPGFEEEKDAI